MSNRVGRCADICPGKFKTKCFQKNVTNCLTKNLEIMNIKNKVQLVGHAGQTPEIKNFGESGKLARFRLATNENYKNKKGEWVENTTWHNLIGWNFIAERIEKQVHKGSYLLIEGKLITRDYTDKDNVKRYITEIDVRSFMVLDKKSSGELNGGESKVNNTQDFYKASVEDEGLPF